jgi:hypothetical protein
VSGRWPDAEIYQRSDGKLDVRIACTRRGKLHWNHAHRHPDGQITFDRPENVPRDIKNRVVRELYKEIDRRERGIDVPAAGQYRHRRMK